MANRTQSPSGASQDWLLRATTKLQKSIFRTVEYKYKKKLNDLYSFIKKLEDDANTQDNELERKNKRIIELEGLLAPFINPTVTVKNLEAEVFRVIPTVEKNAIEEKKKRKFDEVKEISEILELRDAPLSKILKVGPAPRSILPPGIPKKNLSKNREKSTSPPSEPKIIPKKSELKRERSTSPQPQPQLFPEEMRISGFGKKEKRK